MIKYTIYLKKNPKNCKFQILLLKSNILPMYKFTRLYGLPSVSLYFSTVNNSFFPGWFSTVSISKYSSSHSLSASSLSCLLCASCLFAPDSITETWKLCLFTSQVWLTTSQDKLCKKPLQHDTVFWEIAAFQSTRQWKRKIQ